MPPFWVPRCLALTLLPSPSLTPVLPTQVCELQYSKATSNPASWVLAVPENSPAQSAADLTGTIVASELVNTTKK